MLRREKVAGAERRDVSVCGRRSGTARDHYQVFLPTIGTVDPRGGDDAIVTVKKMLLWVLWTLGLLRARSYLSISVGWGSFFSRTEQAVARLTKRATQRPGR